MIDKTIKNQLLEAVSSRGFLIYVRGISIGTESGIGLKFFFEEHFSTKTQKNNTIANVKVRMRSTNYLTSGIIKMKKYPSKISNYKHKSTVRLYKTLSIRG